MSLNCPCYSVELATFCFNPCWLKKCIPFLFVAAFYIFGNGYGVPTALQASRDFPQTKHGWVLQSYKARPWAAHRSLSPRPHLSQNRIPVDVYLPQWDVCLFHSGITNWLFDPLYTRSLSVKGQAGQWVPISHCHRSLSHLSPYCQSFFPFCWGHFDFESWPPECSQLFPDRSHFGPICQKYKHNFCFWIWVVNNNNLWVLAGPRWGGRIRVIMFGKDLQDHQVQPLTQHCSPWNGVPKCHVCMVLEHFQEWWFRHFSG